MKNIQSFEQFNREQELNEGKILDALKSIGRFFKGVSTTLQNNINAYTKKLETTKTWTEALNNLNTMLIQPNTKYFDENMKNATTIDQIRHINYEVHVSTFGELNATHKFWDGNNPKSPIAPAVIFAGTPFAAMYNFDNTEAFTKNLPKAIDALVMTYAKKTQYSEEDVKNSINSYKDLSQLPPKQQGDNQQPKPEGEKPAQGTNPPNQSTNPPTTQQTAGYRFVSFNDFKLISEAGENTGSNPPTGGNTSNANPPESPNTPNQGDTTNNQPNQQQNQQQGKGTIDSLKNENITNFKNNFYGIMQKKMKAFKPTTTPTGGTADKDIQDLTKKMTGSGQNVKSKDNLLKAITDPKVTVGQLADIRDAVAKVLNIQKPDETIGKF